MLQMKTNKTVEKLLNRIDTNKLRNATQRVLLQFIQSNDEWIERTDLKGRTSRVRDLRTEEFGGFRVECRTARQLGRRVKDGARRFYRLDPKTVTVERLNRALKGVITNR